MPRKWIEITGHLSPHQINDAWVSQIGWLLDIVKTIPIMINHERFDLTGKNGDSTFKNRPMLEGNQDNPRDFNHLNWRTIRVNEAEKINAYLKSIGKESTHFIEVIAGKREPWAKMKALDKKNLMVQLKPSRPVIINI